MREALNETSSNLVMAGLQAAKHPGGTAKQNRAQILVLDQGARHEVCKGAQPRLVQAPPLRSLETQQGRGGVEADQIDLATEDLFQLSGQRQFLIETDGPVGRRQNANVDIAVRP